MSIFSAVVNTATDNVVGVHSGKTQPTAKAGEAFVTITEAEYAAISSGLRHEQRGPFRWQRSGDSIVEVEDTRPQLEITLDKTEAATGEAIGFTFQVRDKDGNPLSVNATRRMGLRHETSVRWFRVSVTNGTKSGSKAFNQPGHYEIVGDGSYRVTGHTAFAVFEDF